MATLLEDLCGYCLLMEKRPKSGSVDTAHDYLPRCLASYFPSQDSHLGMKNRGMVPVDVQDKVQARLFQLDPLSLKNGPDGYPLDSSC